MNNQIKRDLVNKILKLSKIQQNEVFNIIKNEGINYSSNNNGIFINLTKIDIDLISKSKRSMKFKFFGNSKKKELMWVQD
jgi:hypothetical protein